MGTRGYVVIKYNGIYYIFYNNSDSYLSSLGLSVLEEIKTIIKLNKLNYVKSLFATIEQLDEFEGSENYFFGIINSLTDIDYCQYMTSLEKPKCNVFIEWIYTVDFDTNVFSIQNYKKHYKVSFSNLPDDLDEDDLIECEEDDDDYDDYEDQEEEFISDYDTEEYEENEDEDQVEKTYSKS